MNYVYYKNTLYKIIDTSNKNYLAKKLKIDNKLILDYDYGEVINNKNSILHHFSNEIIEKGKNTKINFDAKYILLDDIQDYYLDNGKLKSGYINKWSDVVKEVNFTNEEYIIFAIKLLTNGKFKTQFPYERGCELLFCCLNFANCVPIPGAEIPMTYIKKLGYEKLFNILKIEAVKIYLIENNATYMGVSECHCCLLAADNYKGLYNCTHGICFDCYDNWKIKTCPICRASNNLIN